MFEALASFTNLVTSLPFAKIVYSFAILVILSIGTSELYRIWFDRTLEVQVFRFLEDGVPKTDGGTAFTWGVIEKHAALRERFRQAEADAIDAEQVYRTKDDSPIRGTDSVLSDLNITVSEFNVSAFLNYLRRWVSAPQELRGLVTKSGDKYALSGEIRGGPASLADGQQFNRTLQHANIDGADAAIFQTACHLIWVSAAQQQEELARIGRDEFCLWTQYWSALLDIRDETIRNGQLSQPNSERLEKLVSNVSLQVERPAQYKRFRDLRGDIYGFRAVWEIDQQKRRSDRLAAQRDHFDYLKSLNADLRGTVDLAKLAGNKDIFRILAATRPAIPFKEDFSLDYTSIEDTDKQRSKGSYAHFWKTAFADTETVANAARAMGLAGIFNSNGEPIGSSQIPGFAIGNKLVAIAGISFDPSLFDIQASAPYWLPVPAGFKVRFAFTRSPADLKTADAGVAVTRILVLGTGAADLVLLELADHDVKSHPPIPLDASGSEADAEGEFIAVLGYPNIDSRLPALSAALLGKTPGILRVMPGRSTATSLSGASFKDLRLNFEASTTPGTAGGPVIGLHSGKMVGINMAGMFQEDTMLKFGSALRTTDIIGREPFKTVLASGVAAENLSIDPLIDKFVEAQIGPPPAALAAAVEAGFEGREGYAASFLKTEVPLPHKDGLTELRYTHFTVLFDEARRLPAVAVANVDGSTPIAVKRDNSQRYYFDRRVSADHQLGSEYYRGNVFDRGTLLRRGYVTWGTAVAAQEAATDLYSMTVVTPQHRLFNQKSWNDLERFVSDWITRHGSRATVMAGPILRDDDPLIEGVLVPQAFWQILIMDGEHGGLRTAAFLMTQNVALQSNGDVSTNAGSFNPQVHAVRIADIERMTGIDFGPITDALAIE